MELIKSVLEEPIDPLEQEEVKVSFKPSEEDEVESAIEEEVVVKDITKNKKTKYAIPTLDFSKLKVTSSKSEKKNA